MASAEITLRYTGQYRLKYPQLHVLFEIDGKPEWCAIELRDGLSEAEIASLVEKMEGEPMAEKRPTQITITEKGVHELQPGEMTRHALYGHWYIACPALGCGVSNLSGHTVMYTHDGSAITVSPSILCGCGAHYFVEHNKIRWC